MGSFADNICLDCGYTCHDINIWKQGSLPICPKCGGYMIPVYFNRFSRRFDRNNSNEWMEQAQDMIGEAELLLIIGTTGFHSDEYMAKLKPTTKMIQINPGSTMFDPMVDMNIRMDAKAVFDQLLNEI